MCRGVPQALEENAEGVEPSLHCDGNEISPGFIGTFYLEIKICKTPCDWFQSSLNVSVP